jgi:diguanylate cyclase (GGDEF)-like protein
MAKRPPERYNPGELQRTRVNLGELSGDEADRMIEVLGGDISVERADGLIEEKYKKLQALNRRKSDRIIYSSGARGTFPEDSSSLMEEYVPRDEPRYLPRVRMNFIAARPEHGVMTLYRAFASLFSFVLPIQDYINPKFITRGDELFFRQIEELVLSVRGLLAINQRHPVNRLRNDLFVQILSVLKSWDIEGMHQELAHLQMAPRRLTFKYSTSLAKKLFTPIVRLIDLTESSAVTHALKHLYDLDILSHPARQPEIQRIKGHYNKAVFAYGQIFNVIAGRCFPLLMKLACSVCSPSSHTFFTTRRVEILSFLDLTEEDILLLPGSHQDNEGGEPEEAEEVPASPETRLFETPSLQKGFEILERLFPQAGWSSLEDFPDMYPYFQPLIVFPRGFELVPPENPLHQTMVLASILQELFQGFRSVEFGMAKGEDGERKPIGDLFDSISDRWRQFLDELIAGHYLPTLYEYCRDVEKNPHFAESVYGSKQRDYLDWLEKLYILPHLVMGRPKPPETVYMVPKLNELTAELREILSIVARELAGPEGGEIVTIRNPRREFSFEIDNEVSRRLKEVLKLYHEEVTNASLLLYSYAILLLLDTILNDRSSHFYPYPSEGIYRQESESSSVPMYTVPLIDPAYFFREADRSIEEDEKPALPRETEIRDSLTDLLNIDGFRQLIEGQLVLHRKKKIPFVVLSVLLRDFREHCDEFGEESGVRQLKRASEVISMVVREYKDIPARIEDSLFMVLLPGTIREESVNLAIRLFVAFQELKKPKIPVSLGIVQIERTWGKEKLIKTAKLAAERASRLPPPSLSLYDGRKNEFQTLSEVHNTD